MAAGLLYRLMDFQHCKPHGLTEVRVRLSGQHQSLPFACPWFEWALGATAAVLGSWHWGGDW